MKIASRQLRIGKRPLYHVAGLLLACAALRAGPLPLGATPPGKVALVILSHHDDHTWEWGFGGFIAKLSDAGFTCYYVRTTNDEKDSGIGWGKGDQLNLRESIAATRILGMKEVISLNWRNDHMDSVPIKEVRAHYVLMIRKLRPDVLLTWNPWGRYDRNPDHRKVSRAAGEAAWMAGLPNVHPEHLAAGLKPHRVPLVYYTFRSDYGKGHVPNIAIEITEDHVRRKGEAQLAHKNIYGSPAIAKSIRAQLDARGLEIPELAGLTDEQAVDKLQKWSMESWSRKTGLENGVRFAEVFRFVDEWDHLPGLTQYLKDNVVKK